MGLNIILRDKSYQKPIRLLGLSEHFLNLILSPDGQGLKSCELLQLSNLLELDLSLFRKLALHVGPDNHELWYNLNTMIIEDNISVKREKELKDS